MLGNLLGIVGGLGGLVCFILVLVKMFQNGQTGWGIACIVLLLCCGIGQLIAFIYGWINARAWGINNIMMIWTVCIILTLVSVALNPAQFEQLRQLQPLPAR
jgi:hypothetical protein